MRIIRTANFPEPQNPEVPTPPNPQPQAPAPPAVGDATESTQGVKAMVKPNPYGRWFFVLYGNTFPIKGQLGKTGLGFKYYQGTWSYPLDRLLDDQSLRQQVEQITGLNLGFIDDPMYREPAPKPGENKPQQPAQPQTNDPIQAQLQKMREELEKAKAGGAGDIKSIGAMIDQALEVLGGKVDQAAQSEMVKSFLKFSSKFHNYSFMNMMLIWIQNPNASNVASETRWREMGRYVADHSNSISIFRPQMPGRALTPDHPSLKGLSEAEKRRRIEEDKERRKRMVPSFRLAKIYDISSTQPIPNWKDKEGNGPFEPKSWRQDANEDVEELNALANAAVSWGTANGIDMGFDTMNPEMGGYSAGRKIRINDQYKGVNFFSTTVHELAHEVLHWGPERGLKKNETRQEKEIDAETTAYIVLTHYGFDTVDAPNYLALWRAKGNDVRARRDNIHLAAKIIINGIDEQMKQGNIDMGEEDHMAHAMRVIKTAGFIKL